MFFFDLSFRAKEFFMHGADKKVNMSVRDIAEYGRINFYRLMQAPLHLATVFLIHTVSRTIALKAQV